MATRFKHRPTCIIPAAAEQVVNDYLDRQGLGRCFSIPLVLNTTGELLKDTEPRVTHYGTSLIMTDGMSGIIDRLLAAHGGERLEQKFSEAMVSRGAKRDTDSHPYQVVIAIPAGQRAALITRLVTRYPDADARFFKVGLSATGVAPIQAYIDWMYAKASFRTLLDQVINNMPRAEVFIGCRDGNRDAIQVLYGNVNYQGPNPAARSFARVWINGQWDKKEVLAKLKLKVVV